MESLQEQCKQEVLEQLRQLQILMHRKSLRESRSHSAYRGRGRILNLLKENHTMTRRQLEEQLNISRQGLAELLHKLEMSGCIVRETDPNDRRAKLIRLTEQGEQAARENEKKTAPLAALLDCLSPEQLAAFQESLSCILASANTGCGQCSGPERCNHDYLNYGHSKPSKAYCKYYRQWEIDERSEAGGE